MKLVAVMPARNEGWCIGLSLRVALKWCHEVIVLDHASSDETLDTVLQIGHENPDRVSVLGAVGEWDEFQHRQQMLEAARERGATHIAIVDADEVLTANVLPEVKSHVLSLPKGYSLEVPGYNLRAGWKYHTNGIWARRWFSLAFADSPAVSWAAHGDTFHRRMPQGVGKVTRLLTHDEGGVLHLWGWSERRLAAKHALYKLTERLRWPTRDVKTIESEYTQWRATPPAVEHGDWRTIPRDRWPFSPEDWKFKPVPEEWMRDYPLRVYEDTPWQEAEVRRLLRLHPGIGAGLDLFGCGDFAERGSGI